MGAKFAPSVDNLYMAKWEEEGITLNPDPRILLYKHFIDDLIIVWEGVTNDVESLTMNQKDHNISLTWEISDQKIHFLDLEIRNTQYGMETVSYFKGDRL